jgi:Carboxypeptidase regulatory-like domain
MKRALTGTFFLLGLVGALTASAAPAAAQKSAPALTGVVIGPDDKPVPHAVITYQSAGGDEPHIVRADARGHFSIPKLRSDTYQVRASGKGVFSQWQNVALRSGKTKAMTLHTIYAKEIPKAYTATRTYEPNPQ